MTTKCCPVVKNSGYDEFRAGFSAGSALTSCVVLGMSMNLSELRVPHLLSED